MVKGVVLRWLCVVPARRRPRAARLVLWGGETRAAEPGTTAGEVMVEEHGAGGRVVCRADAFRVGRPAPVLAVEDRLEAGGTYVVVPVDRLPAQGQGAVSAGSLAALSYDKHHEGARGGVSSTTLSVSSGRSPFEYVKDGDGRTVISVTEEFIVKAVTGSRARDGGRGENDEENGAPICSTPELRKHYEMLVGAARDRPWSPRLETIEERKARRVVDVVISPRTLSPARLLGLVKGSSERAR
uniref:Uncharacterized protein n=1 Tax=Avena sativa TaxID=4498 RepID=A0ACD5WPM8_AVESA